MKMSIRRGIFGLFLLAVGCGVRPPIEPRMDPYVRPQVAYASDDLRWKAPAAQAIIERRNGLLYVTVPIRSASDFDLHIDYQVTFFNAQGVPIYKGPWEGGITLVRNIPSEIRFNSVSADAADFQLSVRYSE